MKPILGFAVLFIFINFSAIAKDMYQLKSAHEHRGGLNSHNGFADTAETPDEHIREDHHRTLRSTS